MRTALQLDSVRASGTAVPELLEQAGRVGFDGVAFADLEELDLDAVASALDATGLVPVGAQVPYDRLVADREQVVASLDAIGCSRAVVPGLHETLFESERDVARMAVKLSAVGGRLGADGHRLSYRTTGHEFRPLGDRDAFDAFVERAGDGLTFEVDAGAVVAAGRDPAAVVERVSGRVPAVLLRDVDAAGDPTAFGTGVLDVSAVVGAAREAGTGWLVYEHHDPDQAEDPVVDGARRLASVFG